MEIDEALKPVKEWRKKAHKEFKGKTLQEINCIIGKHIKELEQRYGLKINIKKKVEVRNDFEVKNKESCNSTTESIA